MDQEYETRPPHNTMRRWKQAKKTHLKWYDSSAGEVPKNIIRVVEILQKVFSTDGNLYR